MDIFFEETFYRNFHSTDKLTPLKKAYTVFFCKPWKVMRTLAIQLILKKFFLLKHFPHPQSPILFGIINRCKNIPPKIRVKFFHKLSMIADRSSAYFQPLVFAYTAFVYMHYFSLWQKMNFVTELFKIPAPERVFAIHKKIIG